MPRGDSSNTAGDRSYDLTLRGSAWFQEVLGVDVAALVHGSRALARRCLDWTERRPHVAGAPGAAMLLRLFELRWVARVPGSRAVRITTRGADGFARLGLHLAASEPLSASA